MSLCVLAFLMLWAGPALAHQYTYTVEKRGDVQSDFQRFAEIADVNFADIRGWSLNFNVDFRRVSSGQDFRLILASPEEVDRASPACSPQWSCRVGDQVLINDERWRKTTPTWPKSRHAYRHYVINHEVGHWLGLGHADCPGEGQDAPVMMQQSKGLDGCNARVWPKFWERHRVAQSHGVDGWPTPPLDAPCTITGSNGDDRLEAGPGADVVCGRGGDDVIYAGAGFDLVRGGWGNDRIFGNAHHDVLLGGPGSDEIRGNLGDDWINGGRGNDVVHGGWGDDTIRGHAGGDDLYGDRGNNWINGNDGHDVIRGGPGNDVLRGKDGRDVIRGRWGRDFVGGGRGHDQLYGDGHRDQVRGYGGDDLLRGGAHNDVLEGHAGGDRLNGDRGYDRCDPGPGRDVVRGCEA